MIRCEHCGRSVPNGTPDCPSCAATRRARAPETAPPVTAAVSGVVYVAMSAGKTSLKVRDSLELHTRVVGEGGESLDREVSFESSDPHIASVDGRGRVRALRPGPVRIWASCEGQSNAVALDIQPTRRGRTFLYVALAATGLTAAGALASIRPESQSETRWGWAQSARPALSMVSSLSVLPNDTVHLGIGEQVVLEAIPLDATGRLVVGAPLVWGATGEGAAEVSPYGVAVGVAPGFTEVIVGAARPAEGDTIRASVVIAVGGAAREIVGATPPGSGAATPPARAATGSGPAPGRPSGRVPTSGRDVAPAVGVTAQPASSRTTEDRLATSEGRGTLPAPPSDPETPLAQESSPGSQPPPATVRDSPSGPAPAPVSETTLAGASLDSAEERAAAGDYAASLVFYLAADNRLTGLELDHPLDVRVRALRLEFDTSLAATVRACNALRLSDAARGGSAFDCTYPPANDDV